MLVKVDGKSSPAVVKALIKQVRHLPQELRKSLTWDRGLEMAQHKDFSVATHVDVYFCDPRSPWQRGTNENTNRLFRQYLPKQSDLGEHSQAELNKIALRLNQRFRKTLYFRCSAEEPPRQSPGGSPDWSSATLRACLILRVPPPTDIRRGRSASKSILRGIL
jgi:IS30 family transposase